MEGGSWGRRDHVIVVGVLRRHGRFRRRSRVWKQMTSQGTYSPIGCRAVGAWCWKLCAAHVSLLKWSKYSLRLFAGNRWSFPAILKWKMASRCWRGPKTDVDAARVGGWDWACSFLTSRGRGAHIVIHVAASRFSKKNKVNIFKEKKNPHKKLLDFP